jgi:hypothetical protein
MILRRIFSGDDIGTDALPVSDDDIDNIVEEVINQELSLG